MNACPALFIGLYILLGTCSALFFHPIYFFFLALLLILTKGLRIIGPFVALLSFGWAIYIAPPSLKEPITERGIFHIEKVAPSSSPFARSIAYKGTFNKIPCTTYFPEKGPRLDLSMDYLVEGKLSPKNPYLGLLKIPKNAEFTPLKKKQRTCKMAL